METSDPPCDFDAFVAQRRAIGDDEARELIRSWLESYVPGAKLASRASSPATPSDFTLKELSADALTHAR
jgi:hypothetical protein